jgi:hypothetical protein
MRYFSSKADWIYKPVDIEPGRLTAISHESLQALKIIEYKNQHKLKNELHSYWNQEFYNQHTPMLMAWLEELEIKKYFLGCIYTACEANKQLSIHIDSTQISKIPGTKINLLVPVSNCKNSWTVWHDADILEQPLPEFHKGKNYARNCDPTTAVEVARFESIVPYWFNAVIPHQPVTGELEQPGRRIVVSLRFDNNLLLDENIKSYYMP